MVMDIEKQKRIIQAVIHKNILLILSLVIAVPTISSALPKGTIRVSTNSDSADASSYSLQPTISSNGRFIVYTSEANNLLEGETIVGKFMIYDVVTGINEILFKNAGDEVPDGSYNEVAAVSNNGRFVMISTEGSNLDPSDTDDSTDAYLIDRKTGTYQLISQSDSGTEITSPCYGLDVSNNGRFALFMCDGDGVVAEDNNNHRDIFLFDRRLEQMLWVSQSPGIERDDCNAGSLSLSTNAKYVLFSCAQTGTSNSNISLFRFNRITGVTVTVSINADGSPSEGVVGRHGITGDGKRAIFSFDKPMTPQDSNSIENIYLRDIAAGTTELLVMGLDEQLPDQETIFGSLTMNGRYITYASDATNLDDLPDTGYTDIYRYDTATKKSLRISINNSNVPGNGNTLWSSISTSGKRVAFSTVASNLHFNDGNLVSDVFVRILK
jgi:hypothetical protein